MHTAQTLPGDMFLFLKTQNVGAALRYSQLSIHLGCLHPVLGCLVQVLAAPLQIQLPAKASWEAAGDGTSA